MTTLSKSPTLLKNYYSVELIQSIARDCKLHYGDFNALCFVQNSIGYDWQQLALKDRMHRIADMLGLYLPENYQQAIAIILNVARSYSGLAHMCFSDYVERFGLEDFATSMMALEQLTENSSSEFAIRAFILRYPERAMQRIKVWASSDNYHVRRLATEGCRPRLPWAMALPAFKKAPNPVLAIILHLIDDDELYVRRSVANNLNDISKDNPQKIIEIAAQYLGRSKDTDWVIKHACRGLLKQGNQQVLQLFGFADASHIQLSKLKLDDVVALEEKLNFSFELKSTQVRLGKLRVEFIIDFMKANGKAAGKIFKICEGDYDGTAKSIKKSYSFKKITTRKYYVGEHQLHIVINGIKVASKPFILNAAKSS